MTGLVGPSGVYEELHAKKYRGPDESFREGCNRQASALTDGSHHYEVYRHILLNELYLNAGRVQSSVGSIDKVTAAHNCFVSGTIADSFVFDPGNIMQRAAEAAATMRLGGGIGYDFSTLRPYGSLIKGVNSQTEGPLVFMGIYDAVCNACKSKGDRRGAQMGVMRIDHPDIERFIHAKQKLGALENFNISVAVTDEFMFCLKHDKPFPLRFNGEIHREVNAKNLWEMLMRSTWDWAEPGVLFIDTINRMNNLWFCEYIAATNPCVHGDTLVSTTIGNIPIRDLTQYEHVDVYTRLENGELTIKPARFFRTKTKARIVKVTTSRGEIRCTPDHKFLTPNGWIEAQHLKPKQRLIGLNRKKGNETHLQVALTGGKYQSESRMVASYYWGDLQGMDVHHLDGNQYDNSIYNLQSLPKWVHSRLENIGHPIYNNLRDMSNGKLLAKETKSKKKINPDQGRVGVNWYVITVEEDGHAPVFDGNVDDTHNYVANGIVVHNCGEQPLPPFGACLLGSYNLVKFLRWTGTKYEFDWDMLKGAIKWVVQATDNVIDRTIYPLPEQKIEALAKRRMGCGITGLANCLEALGHPYASDGFIDNEARILELIRDESYLASARLAGEKGTFPMYKKREYLAGAFIQKLPGRVLEEIEKHGMRNSHLTSIAPTGTISFCSNNVSSGIEPPYDYHYERTIMEFGGHQKVWVDDYGYKHLGIEGRTIKGGDITIAEHLRVLGTAQQYVDSAISKTCNLSPNITWEDFCQVYIDAYEMGAKGCTTYRPGGKREGIFNSKEDKAAACTIDALTGQKECSE